ncbi:MAG TPA: hypothetical protein VGQ12_03610 [Candidatus Angelobacter sp.]|nr:hypothetical protein [Candidatus Angelobacter sp.]
MRVYLLFLFLLASAATGLTQKSSNQSDDKPSAGHDDAAALTIYNQSFAVVRQTLPLDLKSGTNQVEITNITSHLEPDSVILRDLRSGRDLRILEQNYRSDVASQGRLLALCEGKTIEFLVPDKDGNRKLMPGKIIRSGYIPHSQAYSAYDQQYYQAQQAYVAAGNGEPIIEIDGKLQFGLPGQPIFPALSNDTILKPTLSWLLHSDRPGNTNAEFSYVTGGMSWHADYNVVAPVSGNLLDIVGWVTLDNQTGKTFSNAHIKLMAGDVNKLVGAGQAMGAADFSFKSARMEAAAPAVTERSFDEYHLYTLERPSTLYDRETKQVEFVRASGIPSQRIYVFDGVQFDQNYRNYPMESIRDMENFGIQSNTKIWAMVEFKNSKENHLGLPLPKGRVRFYRRDTDGQMEFTGENMIDHTPSDETIRLYTGNVFDAVGERKRTYYKIDRNAHWVDESFEIKLRNHKKEPMEIRVVEHLYRWSNWDISKNSDPFNKLDSKTVEFRVKVPPDGEKVVTYTAHYSW